MTREEAIRRVEAILDVEAAKRFPIVVGDTEQRRDVARRVVDTLFPRAGDGEH